MTELFLPHPPSANHIWIRGRKGMVKSAGYQSWLEEAGWLARSQQPKKVKGPYKLSISARRPDKRRRDIDNIIKPCSDLLVQIGVVTDDHFCELVSARWVTSGYDGLHVRVEPVGVE